MRWGVDSFLNIYSVSHSAFEKIGLHLGFFFLHLGFFFLHLGTADLNAIMGTGKDTRNIVGTSEKSGGKG